MNSQTSDISTGIRLAMGTGMCLWDMLYRRSTKPEEGGKKGKGLHSYLHMQDSVTICIQTACRAEKRRAAVWGVQSIPIGWWQTMTELFKPYKVAWNVTLNTFRSIKTMCTISLDLQTYSNKMFSADRAAHRAVRVVGGCWYWGSGGTSWGCPAHQRALWHSIGSEMFRINQPEFTCKVWRKTLELEVRGQDSSGILLFFQHYKV